MKEKMKRVIRQKQVILLIMTLIFCDLVAIFYLTSIKLSYDQLKMGIVFSKVVAALLITTIFLVVFMVICLLVVSIATLIIFVSTRILGVVKPRKELIFKTATQTTIMIILGLLLSMGRTENLQEEITEAYSTSKDLLISKMLLTHKEDLRSVYERKIELEVPSISIAQGESKESKTKVFLGYIEKGEFNYQERTGTVTQIGIPKSNFTYIKSETHSIKKEGFSWKNSRYEKAFSDYLSDSNSVEVFESENDLYTVTAPSIGVDLFLPYSPTYNND